MQFFTGLLALLKAIPAMVSLMTEIASWMKSTFGDDPATFLLDAAETFKKAREAKTPTERRDAAVQISQLIRRL
jgi:hypothetical protein